MNKIAFLITGLALVAGCSAPQHRAAVQDNSADRVTVGTVQREISIGMAGAEVIASIGSPNMVSTNEDRNEVWVYDKLATDVVHSDSRAGVLGIVFGPIGGAGGVGIGGGQRSSGAVSTSQRTLTIVIKFDKANRVADFAYHSSRF
jgi:outer membrane protein assembly factor BamE (lipoprotein component of BamABCDE complex)